MDQHTLRDRLNKLHAELTVHGKALPDITRVDATLPERLERVAVQFEADHPELAASARNLVDLLVKAGL